MAFNVCTNRYADWHLNETSGTNVSDASGNGRVGTTVNSPTWVAGKLVNCLSFVSGSSQYVNCGAIASFERTQACSYEFWCNYTASNGAFINKWDTVSLRGFEVATNSGTISFLLLSTVSPANYLYMQTNAPFNDGNWHHVVVTYSGNSSSTGVLIYVDGASKALTVVGDTLSGTILNSYNFLLGSVGNKPYLTGKLDEVVVYDRVLTLTEVTGRYNSGVGTQSCRLPSSNALIGHDF
jgi:hypothetical protein